MNALDAETLVRTYGNRVYRFAYARLGNPADAEDVTQETFLRLCRAAPTFLDERRALSWLFQVAANCAADLCRASWRRHEVCVDAFPEQQGSGPESGGMLDLVLSLPEKYRAVIHLFYYERESIQEIAQVLRISQATVKTRLYRGRRLLYNMLKEDVLDV